MVDFRKIAENNTSSSPVMRGREKIATDDVIAKYPGGITLTGFDIIPNDNGGYAIFTFAEEPDKFINGGSILTKIAFEWADGFDDDVAAASRTLAESGGVKVRLSRKKTKKGNTITAVEVL